jgi:hypothetical protein
MYSFSAYIRNSNKDSVKDKMPPLSSSTLAATRDETPGISSRKRSCEEDNASKELCLKRRASMPDIVLNEPLMADEASLHRCSSCNEIKDANYISPAQLLQSRFRLKRRKFIAGFVRPDESALSSYDSTVVNAIRSANLETLTDLQKQGKSFNACNQFGESLLHMACRRGNPDIVRFLVDEAKVKVDVRDDYGRTCLHDATWTTNPNFDVMDILLKAINPELLLAEDVRGHTPFDYARKEHWGAWINFLADRQDSLKTLLREDVQNEAAMGESKQEDTGLVIVA